MHADVAPSASLCSGATLQQHMPCLGLAPEPQGSTAACGDDYTRGCSEWGGLGPCCRGDPTSSRLRVDTLARANTFPEVLTSGGTSALACGYTERQS